MPGVSWLAVDPLLASARYRRDLIVPHLRQFGVQPGGRDVLVLSKHLWDWDDARGFRRVVYDVCDDHFQSGHADKYLEGCARADAVTCNSAEMARRIKTVTGRDAWVIDDPYEQPECEPRVGPELLWFGHKAGLLALRPWLDRIAQYPLTVVTGGYLEHVSPSFVPWSPQNMDAAFDACGMVLLPTLPERQCKSANRAIESVRRGRWPVCGPLPAFADLGVWVGDIADGVQWALENPPEVLRRLRASQDYVRERYAPRRIAERWADVFKSI